MFKRFAIATLSAGVAVLGAGAVVGAAPNGGAPYISFTPNISEFGPGDYFSVFFNNCQPGETVIFTYEGKTVNGFCNTDAFAGFQLTPEALGTFTVTAIGTEIGIEATKSYTVTNDTASPGPSEEPPPSAPTDGLADTGTDVTKVAVLSGIALLAGGLSISLWLRRRAV